MISALKPIGVPLALILIIIGLVKIKKINQVILISVFFLIPNIVENFFYSNFSKRKVFLSIQLLENFYFIGKSPLKFIITLKIFVSYYLLQKKNLNRSSIFR